MRVSVPPLPNIRVDGAVRLARGVVMMGYLIKHRTVLHFTVKGKGKVVPVL
jgi:hypothetical protein